MASSDGTLHLLNSKSTVTSHALLCRRISFRAEKSLPFRPGTQVTMECQGHVIDTYSQSGQVVLPNSTTLNVNRCNLMIFRDFEQSLQAQALWPTFGANAELGPTSGASFHARNCTVQFNHMVCPPSTVLVTHPLVEVR